MLILSPSLFEKMTVTFTEENEGGMTITFDWDDTDPAFEPWDQMGKDEQRNFLYASICNKIQGDLDAAS